MPQAGLRAQVQKQAGHAAIPSPVGSRCLHCWQGTLRAYQRSSAFRSVLPRIPDLSWTFAFHGNRWRSSNLDWWRWESLWTVCSCVCVCVCRTCLNHPCQGKPDCGESRRAAPRWQELYGQLAEDPCAMRLQWPAYANRYYNYRVGRACAFEVCLPFH